MSIEFIAHFAMFIVLLFFAKVLWTCIKFGKENYDSPWASTDDKIHLIDHLLGAVFSIVGALVTMIFLFLEMISHIVGDPAELHVAIHIGLCMTLVGATYLAWHIQKEEDPAHPFYHWLGRRKEHR